MQVLIALFLLLLQFLLLSFTILLLSIKFLIVLQSCECLVVSLLKSLILILHVSSLLPSDPITGPCRIVVVVAVLIVVLPDPYRIVHNRIAVSSCCDCVSSLSHPCQNPRNGNYEDCKKKRSC